MSGIAFIPLHSLVKPKCKTCNGYLVIDYKHATSTCRKCGLSTDIILENNCVTFNDASHYDPAAANSLRRSGSTTVLGPINQRHGKTISKSAKRHRQTDNDVRASDGIKCIKLATDRMTQTRSTRRYNNIRIVIDEIRSALKLTDAEIDRVFDMFDRMKPEQYPRSVELHTRVLITIVTMNKSGRTLKDLCRGSKSVAVKDLAGCLKAVCKSMEIPVVNPSAVISTAKYSLLLGMSRYQTARSERIVKYLLKKCPSLHPATHISTAILISKVHGRFAVELTSTLVKRIADVVETTASTLNSSYDMVIRRFPETKDTNNKLLA